jgi:hypothetical protein
VDHALLIEIKNSSRSQKVNFRQTKQTFSLCPRVVAPLALHEDEENGRGDFGKALPRQAMRLFQHPSRQKKRFGRHGPNTPSIGICEAGARLRRRPDAR